jgi:hypothetical protein
MADTTAQAKKWEEHPRNRKRRRSSAGFSFFYVLVQLCVADAAERLKPLLGLFSVPADQA